GFPYRKQKISLRNNDTLLLLSDGLQELFNQEHEMFGWQRVVNLFEDHGHLAPQELIDTLNGETDRWRGEKPIDDDITMVVLKYKAD
ncbi:MAG: SpoIIE family protein phosphatase, partial [Balneolaceae bacterium]|nr:SpoIIE family protein phosphatase [Balneolaceae bacterium]